MSDMGNPTTTVTVDFNADPAIKALGKFSKDWQEQNKKIDESLSKSEKNLNAVRDAIEKLGLARDTFEQIKAGTAATNEQWRQMSSAIKKVADDQKQLTKTTNEESNKRAQTLKKEAETTAQATTVAATKKKDSVTLQKPRVVTEEILKRQEGQKELKLAEENISKRLILEREASVARNELRRRETAEFKSQLREQQRLTSAYNAVVQRSLRGQAQLQQQVTAAIGGTIAAQKRAQMVAGGMTPHQALQQQLIGGGIGAPTANYLVAGGRRPPPGFLPPGGGGGGFNNMLGMLGFGGGGGAMGSILRNAMGGLGIGAGAYGVTQAVGAIKQSADQATAYDRMEVSARKLAGSQAELNALLEAYNEASGDAISQVTALEQVTRLQATGFAESADQVERFVRGARGAALSLGKPQDFIVQETQLAVSNTSFKRLDQIGLGIGEVTDRIAELREENKGLTQEMAFQEAVIGLLNEKYGSLSDTVEGQASGSEKLTKSVDDLNLAFGQLAQGPVTAFGTLASLMLEGIRKRVEELTAGIEALGNVMVYVARNVPGLEGLGNRLTTSTEREMWSQPGDRGERSRSLGSSPRKDTGLDEDQLAAAMDWSAARAQIQRNADTALLEEHRSYTQQYRRLQADFQQTILREEEDYNRNREKQEANFSREMSKVQQDSARREANEAKQLADQLARMDRDAGRQEAMWERDQQRNLEAMRADHARKIADIEEEHSLRIQDARDDSLKRLGEMQVDYDDRIAEAREESTDRLTEMETDYNKEKEKAAEDHALSLLEAAEELDARGWVREERRYAKELEQAEEAHQEQIQEEADRLKDFETEADEDHQKAITKEQERLAEFEQEANESHQRRLTQEGEALALREQQEAESLAIRRQDAKDALALQKQDLIDAHAAQKAENDAADALRLSDMQAAHELQREEEETDRGIRLERMKSDHTAQMQELGRAHGERIQQIKDHAIEERTQLDTEFETRMAALGIEVAGYAQEYEKLKNIATGQFDQFMIHAAKKLYEERTGQKAPANPNQAQIDEKKIERAGWQEQADANAGDKTSEAYQFAVGNINRLDREIQLLEQGAAPSASAAAAMMGGVATIANTNSVGGSNSSIVIQSGAIQITALPGQSPSALGDEFERRLLSVIQKASRVI